MPAARTYAICADPASYALNARCEDRAPDARLTARLDSQGKWWMCPLAPNRLQSQGSILVNCGAGYLRFQRLHYHLPCHPAGVVRGRPTTTQLQQATRDPARPNGSGRSRRVDRMLLTAVGPAHAGRLVGASVIQVPLRQRRHWPCCHPSTESAWARPVQPGY